jgi:ABC-type branched-subunit amino acid transport system substrate-binding protein
MGGRGPIRYVKGTIGAVAVALLLVSCGSTAETTTTAAATTTTGATGTTATTMAETTTTSGSASTTTAAMTVQTDKGVTDDTITLGILTDLTGPFAAQGAVHIAAGNLYWDQVNADGGICGRQIKIDAQDNGYDPQKALAAYQAMEPNILALVQLLGSPVQAAVLPEAQADNVTIGIVGWSSEFLKSESVVTTGATYDIQFIDGLQYLLDQGLIADGDTIGHIYFSGDFGENGLLGSKFFAEQHGMTVMEAAIDPTVTDLTTQVSGFKDAGATAILIGAAPPQLAALTNAEMALDYNVPILGQVPPFFPTLMDDPAMAGQLTSVYYEATPIAPLAVDTPESKMVSDQFVAQNPDLIPDVNVNFAYAQAEMFGKALQAACENGDLTRTGFTNALHSLVNVETGLATPLSYNVGGPAGTAVYMARPNADLIGALEVVAEDVTSPLVDQYQLP